MDKQTSRNRGCVRKAATLLAVGLWALTSFAYEYVTVGDGETVTIGEGVANSGTSGLSASAGATIVLRVKSLGTVLLMR